MSSYNCADCGHELEIELTGEERSGSLRPGRAEHCDECGQRVGRGHVECRSCGRRFVVDLPHWHAACTLATGRCPGCGAAYGTTCIC